MNVKHWPYTLHHHFDTFHQFVSPVTIIARQMSVCTCLRMCVFSGGSCLLSSFFVGFVSFSLLVFDLLEWEKRRETRREEERGMEFCISRKSVNRCFLLCCCDLSYLHLPAHHRRLPECQMSTTNWVGEEIVGQKRMVREKVEAARTATQYLLWGYLWAAA